MTNKIQVSKNEQGRIAALKLYDILDTPPEQEFDNLAQLAAEICNTPIALINLIDEKRQWTKASVGIDLREMPREVSFCHYTILDDEIFEITNPLADTRFEQNPLVTDDPGVRFYAGIPLINKEGYRLGSLCVLSPKHHKLNSYQRISLQILTASVMTLLELRREKRDADAYRDALDEIAVVSVLNTHQNLIYANEKFCKMVGLSEAELLGKNISEVKLSDITEEQAHSISNSIVERRNWNGLIKNQNIKGVVSWSNLTILPCTNKDNEISKILTIRQDVTREVMLNEQLETTEELAKTGSWELNIFSRKTTWTPGMYTLLDYDYTEGRQVEQSIMNFVHPADFERVNEANKRMLEKAAQTEELEFKIITKKGKVKDIKAIVKKRFNSKGGLTGIYGTFLDGTAHKTEMQPDSSHYEQLGNTNNDVPVPENTQLELQQANSLVHEAQNQYQSLLGKVNYDVLSPLNAVIGLVGLLGTTPLSIEQKVLLAGIKESSANMQKVIDTLLEENNTLPDPNVKPFGDTGFELRTLINNLIINLKPEADKKNVRFILQIDNKIPTPLIADPVRLTKILQCLTGNALKYTEKGSISISVFRKVAGQNMVTLEFIVKDTGVGIPQNKLDNIFNKKPQNKTPLAGKSDDTATGLIVARKLIEEHNGVMKVRSAVGMGTTFSFTFQCRQISSLNNTEKIQEAENGSIPDAPKIMPVDKSTLVGYNILLVEDNIMNQRVGRITVENWGANVTVVDRGKKAIELIATNKFDVILMDLQMPEMSGIEATEIIRQDLKIHTPILGMTVSEMQGNRDMCIRAGMNDYILKPLNPVELHQKIIGLLNKPEIQPNDKLINISYIQNITDNDTDLIREILEIYINKTPSLIDEIDNNITIGDFKQVKAGVHYLKNSVGLLGADTLFHLLATIEDQLNYLPPSNDTLTLLSKMKDNMLQSIYETEEELMQLG